MREGNSVQTGTAGERTGQRKPKIMLSGFDAEAEKTYMTNIIKKLGGVYVHDDANPQAFIPACTHIICKKPNRSEKYLAGCAAGKWILTPYFLHNSDSQGLWAKEEDYEWGVNITSMYSSDLQQAPKRWRETIKVHNRDPPFLGWSVGLVMRHTFVQAYTRIIEAGGGAAVDISSWYTPQAANREIRTVNEGLLTHILVTPHMVENVTRFRTEDILCLKAEYLAQFLLNATPPSIEKYSLFRRQSPANPSKHFASRKPGASPKVPVPRQDYPSGDDTESSQYSYGSGISAEALRPSPKKDSRPAALRITSTPKQSPKTLLHLQATVPLGRATGSTDSDSSPKPSKCVISTVKIQTKPGAQATLRSPLTSPKPLPQSLLERSLFKTFENAENLASPVTVTTPGRRSSKEAMINLQDIRSSLPKTNQRPVTVTSFPGSVPDISLGKRRTEPGTKSLNKGSSFKQNFTDEFFEQNFNILQEFAGMTKHQNTPYGMVEELFRLERKIQTAEKCKDRCARPFSRDVVTSLEASLEVNYMHGYLSFLNEVSGRTCWNIYPPPDVIYVIMKVILLDTDNPVLASSAFSILNKILELHPPQSPDIKAAKLYHKAFTVMTIPDEAEPSPVMLAVGCMLSQTNENWSLWCNRDPVLGAHWAFYSRVIHIALTKPRDGGEESGDSTPTARPVRNAVLLTIFLTKLVVKDYEDVITRSDFPTNNPMIKCLIADLLWPAMTGLEPWFRRPSPNLADLVSLFVKAVESHASQAEMSDEDIGDDSDVESDDDTDEDNTGEVLDQISRLLTVTASWCVYCDLREKERGKRSASRPLEFELVKALRSELEDTKAKRIELALENLPPRLRLKVNAALIKEACTEDLVAEENKTDPDLSLFEDLSLELITSRYMQLLPIPAENDAVTSDGESPKQRKTKTAESESEKNDAGETRNAPSASTQKTAYKVNKRNAKGETALHIACMQNKPDIVRRLLDQPGINPNLTDFAGWTPLGEACNHGHMKCVEALLELPAKKDRSDPDKLQIDTTLCPREGQTPLHDALGNGHLEIACILLEKGGVEQLDKLDSEKKTPLDYCSSDASRTYMIEYACKLAIKERERKPESEADENKSVLMTLADKETYEKALPPPDILNSGDWNEQIRWYYGMISLLVSHYVTSGYLVRACAQTQLAGEDFGQSYCIENDVIVMDDSDEDVIPSKHGRSRKKPVAKHSNVPTSTIKHFAKDATICLRWRECWSLFREHVYRLVGEDEDVFREVTEDSGPSITNDWISDYPPF